MKYMLDTDTFSYLVNGIPQVIQRYAEVLEDDVGLSVVSYGEILFGVSKQKPSASKQKRIDYLLDQMPISSISEDVAKCYGQVRSKLELAGKPIGPNDTWIAAHAMSIGAILVTGNLREYKRVAGLDLENWV